MSTRKRREMFVWDLHRRKSFKPSSISSSHHNNTEKDTKDLSATPRGLDNDYHLVQYSSSSVFPPKLRQEGNSLEEILLESLEHRIYPHLLASDLEADTNYRNIIVCLKSVTEAGGHCLISKSLPTLCRFKTCTRPSSILVDVVLVTVSQPPVLLTFTEDSLKQTDEVVTYNRSVAKALMFARYFTDEAFDIMYGVMSSEDTRTDDIFRQRLSDVIKQTSVYCIPSNLAMSAKRCGAIYKALITCSALETSSDPDCYFVLPKNSYKKLMSHINDSPDEIYLRSVLEERLSTSDQKRFGNGNITDLKENGLFTTVNQLYNEKAQEKFLATPDATDLVVGLVWKWKYDKFEREWPFHYR